MMQQTKISLTQYLFRIGINQNRKQVRIKRVIVILFGGRNQEMEQTTWKAFQDYPQSNYVT